ncbi:VOC family protein [Paenibacillus monticola]|uniref:VOC family protein n=1 Tax=Paenibacillus monticola TaxID=2666075 RepID=A0A7X2L293_9BACL|nr:VOC family protein [Paenibacillus monticola]MRN53963.1 VOC family protein [Paenibacillus monticola]
MIDVGLFVGNMEKMVTFYRDVLNFETGWDGGLFATFKKDTDQLFMFDRKHFAESIGETYVPPSGINLTMEMYMRFATNEVDQEYERLSALNVRIIEELSTKPWGQRNFFIADPEGNIIEIGD